MENNKKIQKQLNTKSQISEEKWVAILQENNMSESIPFIAYNKIIYNRLKHCRKIKP